MPQELIPSEQNLETPIRYVPAERLAVVGEPRIPALPHSFVTSPEPELESLSAPLSHYLWILRRHRWRMLAFITFVVAATYFLSKRLTPI